MAKRRSWTMAAGATAFALGLPAILAAVSALSYRIPQTDRGSDYMKGSALAALIMFGLAVLPLRGPDKRNLLILWGAKIAVCLGAMLFYEWTYGLDAYDYFERSQHRFPDFQPFELGNGTENLTAIFWYIEHYFFPLASYHAQKVLCAFLGLCAVFLFYRGLRKWHPRLSPKLLLYLGLFPSVLFWSSILGKDPVVLLGICLFFYGALSFFRSWNPLHLATIATGLFVTAIVRTWIVPILVIPFFIGTIFRIRKKSTRMAALALVVMAGIYSLRYLQESLALESSHALEQVNNVSKAWQHGGSAGSVPELNSMGAVVRFLPIGIFTALFRPLPGEIMNPFGLLSGLENLFLLWLLFLAFRKPGSKPWADPTVIWCLGYILIWAVLYAFISPQNMGSAVRFRLQVLPMMIFVLLFVSGQIRRRDPGSQA